MKRYVKNDYRVSESLISHGWKIVILSLIAIVMLIAAVRNAVDLQNALGLSTVVYTSDITREMTTAISDTIEWKKAELVSVAESMRDIGGVYQEKDTADFMRRKAEILGFDEMILFNRQGDYILSSNLDRDLDVDMEALLAMSGVQDAFEGNTSTSYYGEQNLYYSAPVRNENTNAVEAVLVGIRSRENMQSLIAAKSFGGKCLNCVVDSRHRLVMSPTDMRPFEQLEDIFEDASDKDKEDILEMQKNISEGEGGVFKFTSLDGNENYLSYNPLNVNDWILLTIVPADLISAGSEKYIIRSLILIGSIFVMLAAFWLIIYRMYHISRKELWNIAFIDPLTKGMNNQGFQLRYEEAAGKHSMSEYVIVLLDAKNFKLVNENFGVMAGNKVLCYIYQVIERHIKKDRDEFVTRSETDHYFLCMKEQGPEAVQKRINEIIEDINQFHDADCPHYPLSFRQGACFVKDSGMEIDTLQDRARVAAQKEIADMAQECVFYDEGMTEKIKKEQELDALFEESFANHDFQVYLQPKVGLADGRLTGAEALIRWKHPQRGMIFPSDFIPLFEKNGKICRLDLYVFEETCKILSRWKQEGKELFPISVNLSRRHFYQDNFLEEFAAVFRKYDLPAEMLEFELTESIFLDDAQISQVKECIRQMHRMGFGCSLDDFGSGFSSLGLLKEFDVDTVKLDRRFFLDISSEKAKDVIRCLVDLAKKLHMKTVAEGIEDREQLEYLRSIQCDSVQGYIFSRPLPVEEFEQWENSNF